MKVLFAYELLYPPYDEGVKKFAFNLSNELMETHTTRVVSYFQKMPMVINNIIFIPRIISQKIFFNPNVCVYMPQASLTFLSYIKVTVLNLFYKNKLVIIGTQKRELSTWQVPLIRFLGAPDVFVMSSTMAEDLSSLGIKSHILNIGIDLNEYKPVEDKKELRNKYKLPTNKEILLHVGHIRESRNIRWLIEIQRRLKNIQVVIIGSTSTSREVDLYNELTHAGVTVVREYLPKVSELYQLSDYYCFPVVINTAAMEIPLSVLEAMATNIPVLTTRFGRLPELFPEEDEYYRYIESTSDIINQLQTGFVSDCNNREKMKDFTWKATVKKIISHTELFK